MYRIVPVILKFLLFADALALRGGLLSVLTNRNPEGDRIINGIEVKSNEIKYVVFIYGKTRNNRGPWSLECGGCIVAERYILTAAHCIFNRDNAFAKLPLFVVPGIVDAYSVSQHRHFKVAKAYVPRAYEWIENGTDSTAGDIAVLKLRRKLRLYPHSTRAKINLPPANATNTYAGMQALVAGFGADDFEYEYRDGENQTESSWTWTHSGKLRKIHARVITDVELDSLSDYNCEPRDDVICAVVDPSYEYGGTCYGDSGSPLVVGNTVVGVVSGINDHCNHLENPERYTRVSNFVGFIKNVIRGVVTPDMRVHSW